MLFTMLLHQSEAPRLKSTIQMFKYYDLHLQVGIT